MQITFQSSDLMVLESRQRRLMIPVTLFVIGSGLWAVTTSGPSWAPLLWVAWAGSILLWVLVLLRAEDSCITLDKKHELFSYSREGFLDRFRNQQNTAQPTELITELDELTFVLIEREESKSAGNPSPWGRLVFVVRGRRIRPNLFSSEVDGVLHQVRAFLWPTSQSSI